MALVPSLRVTRQCVCRYRSRRYARLSYARPLRGAPSLMKVSPASGGCLLNGIVSTQRRALLRMPFSGEEGCKRGAWR